MPKKRRPIFEDLPPDDELFAEDFFLDDGQDVPLEWDEHDIIEVCGKANAAKGLALYQNGQVTGRAFDGVIVQGTVADNVGTRHVEFDMATDGGKCPCPVEQRARESHCEHIAALLYAYVSEPQSFVPQTLGAMLGALKNNPELREQLKIPASQLGQISSLVSTTKPELRTLLDTPFNELTAIELQQIQNELANSAAQAAETELRNLLEGLPQNQLRAMAQRRGWTISQNKNEMVAQLTVRLQAEPVPATFTPEEEQLLRLENTLYGLGDSPTPESLNYLWKQRAGGDLLKLDKARRGLANAGVLLECRRESAYLHYHWSPVLKPERLPLQPSKLTPLAPTAVERLTVEPSYEPLLERLEALLEFISQRPLPVQLPERDPQLMQHPFVGQWNYDPAEAERLLQPRYNGPGMAEGMRVPFPLIISTHDLDTMAVALNLMGTEHEARMHAMWLTGQLLANGLVNMDPSKRLTTNPPRIAEWHTLRPDAQLRQLWETQQRGGMFEFQWVEAQSGIQMRRSLYIGNQLSPPDLQSEMAHARRFVARLLMVLQPEAWYMWNDFAQYVQNLRADFLHTNFGENHFWLADSSHAKLSASVRTLWDKAYRPMLAAQFETALRWFGAVELAHDKTWLAGFQITPLGKWLLQTESAETFPTITSALEPSDLPLVTWLSDDTFRVRSGRGNTGALTAARLIAEPTKERLLFRVSNDALARTWERGGTPQTIAQKFGEAGILLPDTLQTRIERLYADYGRVHLYQELTVLELADDFAVRELLASTALRQYILHQFSPRVVVMRDDAVDKFVTELEKKGYTPRVI